MDSKFLAETTLEKISDENWIGSLSKNWNIGDVPNGGYLLAVVLRSMQQQVGSKGLISVSAHFLRPGNTDSQVEVKSKMLKDGRRISTYEASLLQDGKESLKVIADFGDLSSSSKNSKLIHIDPPFLPPPEDCKTRSSATQGIELPIQKRVEVRVAEMKKKTERAELFGWVKFCDSTPPDPLALVFFSDAFPPSIFTQIAKLGWVPTVELSVQIRRVPADGWVLGHFYTDDLHNGSMIETGRLWDSRGFLVAQSRQLALAGT